MASLLEHAVALPFRAISALRGARSLHPHGVRAKARWTIHRSHALAGDASVLSSGATLDGVARLSRSVGLPEVVPDILGVAVRLGDQDLLFASTLDVPVVHHFFLPSPGWFAQPYCTCLPLDAGGGAMVVGLLAPPRAPRIDGSLEAIREQVAARVSFAIALAAPLGRFEPIGTLELFAPFEDSEEALRFNVHNAGGGLRPVGLVNRLRDEAYRASRRGRGVPEA